MPDFLSIFSKWWKTIVGMVLIVTAITAVILLLQTKQYLSTVTALPAASVNYDKSTIFNDHIQSLYSSIGGADELDKVLGTAELDTFYISAIRQFDLIKHYKEVDTKTGLYRTIKELRDNVEIFKTEYGELKIKAWDKDPELAANMANFFYDNLQTLHQYLQNQSNQSSLQKLEENYLVLQQQFTNLQDSLQNGANQSRPLVNIRLTTKTQELAEYEKLISQYTLMIKAKPQVLLLVERARPGLRPERPKLLPVFIMAAFASLIFGLLLAIFLESRKKS